MNRLRQASSIFARWIAFNLVGAIGIVVQLTSLMILTGGFGLAYLPATAIAVEAAVIHNFVWHERWTWSDRTRSLPGGLWQRILYFHCTNGTVSIAGNLLFMRLFVERLGLNYLAANALAIALCSVANFIAGNCFVFRSTVADSKKGR